MSVISCQTVGVLKQSRLFSDLDEVQLAELSKMAVERHVKAGEFIFFEGDILDHFILLARGRAKILSHSLSGKDFIMAFVGPADMLGNIPMLSARGHESTSSAQAMTDTTVLLVRNAGLTSFLSGCPEMSFKVLRRMAIVLGIRLARSLRRLTDMAAESADYRLSYVLFTLSQEFGLRLPFTREEVAQMAGTTRETATRFVKRLKKKGVVRSLRGGILILDRQPLAAVVEGSSRPDRPEARTFISADADVDELNFP